MVFDDTLHDRLLEILQVADEDELREMGTLLKLVKMGNPTIFALVWPAYRAEVERRKGIN